MRSPVFADLLQFGVPNSWQQKARALRDFDMMDLTSIFGETAQQKIISRRI
jgi:hypothetical protein